MPSENLAFISSIIIPLIIPEHPLKRRDWAGLSFDRNWHEDLAPTEIWEGLFTVHNRLHNNDVCLVAFDVDQAERVETFRPSIHDLRTKLDEGFKFLEEFYVIPPSKDWLVRIDYDVTLFCGDAALLKGVVAFAGGLDRVEEMMMCDFDGFEDYIHELVRPLRK
jgi:hypothetical protein